MAEEALGGGGVEEVGVGAQDQLGAPAVEAPGEEGEVELDRPALCPEGSQAEPGKVRGKGRLLLEGEEDLEDRRVPQVALGRQLPDQLLEGEVLVGVGSQSRLAHPLQESQEAGVVREVRAHHQGIDEEADQPLDLGAVAVGDGRPHQEVGLAGDAEEERLPGGEQGHEQGGARAACQGLQAGHGRGRQLGAPAPAAEDVDGRPRPVQGEGQDRWSTGQALAPPAELPLQDLPLEPLSLPEGEVGVLDGQLRQARAPVQRTQLADQHAHGPAVGDDVVKGEGDGVLLRAETRGQNPDQGAGGEIERPLDVLVDPARQLGFAAVLRKAGEVRHRQAHAERGGDDLDGPAAGHGEGGAQGLVTPDHLVQGRLQEGEVEPPLEAHGGGEAPGRAAGVELVQEPEPLLGEGEGGRLMAEHGHDRRCLRGPPAGEGGLDPPGEPGHGRRLEKVAQGDLDPEPLAQARHHLGGQERMSAGREEIGFGAQALAAEELLDDRQHLGLGRRSWRGRAAGDGGEVWSRQGAAIDFAARGARQGVEHDDGGGDQGLRQALPGPGAQLGDEAAGEAAEKGIVGERPRSLPLSPLAPGEAGAAVSDAQDHLVAEAGQLVVDPSPLRADLDACDPRDLLGQGVEQAGIHEQLGLFETAGGGAAPQDVLRQRRVLVTLHSQVERVGQSEIADVPDVHRAAVGRGGGGLLENLREIVRAGKVLDDGVEDDSVEGPLRQTGEVMRRAPLEVDLGEIGHPAGQVVEGRLGKVGADIERAVRRDPPQDEARAAADLQDPPGAELEDILGGGLHPVAHLRSGDGLAGEAAVPAHEVGIRVRGIALAAVDLVVEPAPGLHLLDLLPGPLRALRHDPGHQAIPAEGDGGRLDLGMRGQACLHLAGLDTEAADLHLVVEAAEKFQTAVRQVAGEVARAVEAGARGPERVGDEPLGGEIRPAEVAAGEPLAGHAQLSRHADRNRLQPVLQEMEPRSCERSPEVGQLPGLDLPHRAGDRGLGGAIGDEQAATRRPARGELRRTGFAAHDQGAEGRRVGRPQGSEQGRRQVKKGDRPLAQQEGERRARHALLAAGHVEGGSRAQGQSDLRDGDVEAQRHHLEDAVAGGHAIGPDQRVGETGERAVGHGDPLGPAGGAGGIDDVGESLLPDPPLRSGRGRPGQGKGPQSLAGQQEGAAGIGQHPLSPGLRPGGVQRHPGGSRQQDPEDRLDHGLRPVQAEADADLGTRPHREEPAGEPGSPAVELAVRDLCGARDERGSVRRLADPRREPLGQQGDGARLRPGGAPLPQELVPLLRSEQRQRSHGTVGLPGGGVEETGQVPLHPQDGGRLEQVAVVLDPAAQASVVLGQEEGEVGLGGAGVRGFPLQRREREIAHPRLVPGKVLEAVHHLAERVMGKVPGELQLLDELLEREILVRVGVEGHLPHPPRQLREGRLSRQAGPQHQDVDEEADQVLDLAAVAVRHGGAHDDVVPSGQAGEQEVVGGEGGHREGRPQAAAQLSQPPGEILGDVEGGDAAAEGLEGRARAIEREVEDLRRVVELPAPVGELPLQGLAGEPAALPDREVGVLHRQLGQGRGAAICEGVVEDRQLAPQHAQGPAVRDDVMEVQEQRPRSGGSRGPEPGEEGAQERPALEVERPSCLLLAEGAQLGLTVFRARGRVQSGQVDHRQLGVHALRHRLPRLAFHEVEGGAQRLVAAHDLAQGAAQGRDVEAPVQTQTEGHDVEGIPRDQAVEEPEPLLGEGEREIAFPGDGDDRRRRSVLSLPRQARGHLRQGRRLEQGAEGDLDAEGLADARGELRGEQRVAAQREEVVVAPHPLAAEQLAPDPGQQLLGRGAGGRGGRGGMLRRAGGEGHPGEGAAVHLAVGCDRQAVEADEGRGNQRLGQMLLEEGAQLRRRGAGGHPEGGKPAPARQVVAEHDGGLGHGRMTDQSRLDLSGLDAEAADLDLAVHPAQILQLPGSAEPGEVARPVEARSGLAGEAVGDEALGGEIRPSEVAPGEARAAHVQLARHAQGRRLVPRPQHVDREVRDRPADGAPRAAPGVLWSDRPEGHVHGGLRDAVHVDQPRAVRRSFRLGALPPGREAAGVQGLAAEDHPREGGSHRLPRPPLQVQQRVEGRGGLIEHGDTLALQEVRESLGGAARLPGHDHQPPAERESPPDLPDREVEGAGVEEGPDVPLAEAEPGAGGREQPGHVAMRHRHPLGLAGGAGGVDDVGGVVGEIKGRKGLKGPKRHQGHPRERGSDVLWAHHHGRLRIRDDPCQPLFRPGRIEGHVHASGGQDSQDRHDQTGLAVAPDGDRDLRTHAAVLEAPGQTLGAPGQLAIGQGHACRGQCGCLGPPHGLGGEESVEIGPAVDLLAGPGLDGELVALRLVQHRELGHGPAGIGGRSGDQVAEVPDQPADRRGVEEIRVALGAALDPPVPLCQHQGEIVLRGARGDGERLDLQAGEAHRGRQLRQGEDDLEQGGAGQAALGLELFHELLEGEVLARPGLQADAARAIQQLAEGCAAVHPPAQGPPR